MKISVHKAGERGGGEHGWLRTWHSFSFSDYYNPKRMNFGLLRVLNEDIIQPGEGFDTHAHDNMEIVTIVLEGALEHKDSGGGRGVIRPGEVQSMSAGSGVRHSEFNHSKSEAVRLLQIWIETKEQGIKPRYEQKNIPLNGLTVVASQNKGGVYIHQDAILSRGTLKKHHMYNLSSRRGAFVFVISGEITIGNETLRQSDSAEITGTDSFAITPSRESDVLVIEVPMN